MVAALAVLLFVVAPLLGGTSPTGNSAAFDRYKTREDAQHGAYLCRRAAGTVRWYDARTNRCDLP